MMIMAQHPQQQRPHNKLTGGGGGGDHSTTPASQRQKQQQQHVAPIQTQTQTQAKTATISDQQQQDGKRTLIKNQLYLIEQLQLENANLRNERDQLQLENEELKFQLQMISSSNILHQPGPTFNDQHLERLVGEGDGKIAHHNHHHHHQHHQNDGSTPPTPVLARQTNSSHLVATTAAAPSGTITTATPTATPLAPPNQTNLLSNQVKLLVTPLRQPMKQNGDIGHQEKSHSTSQQPLARLPRSAAAATTTTNTAIVITDAQQAASQRRQGAAAAATANKKSLGCGEKSTSLSAFNVKSCEASSATSRNLLIRGERDEDEEEKRVKLVEQLYGGDSGRLQEAAIVIQRAFRKYQICKRFRTITEQLRHTYHHQSSPASSASCSPPTSIINQAERKHPAGLTTAAATATQACDEARRPSLSSSSASSSSTNTIALASTGRQPIEVPFASGATRAAAWESLSYAASRLAASATAAKQSLANGVAKVSSQQQANPSVISSSQAIKTGHPLENNRAPTVQGATASPTTTAPTPTTKQDSVVAAAINFQQLESIRKRQYRVGLNIFNKNPEEGVSFLVAHSFIDSSAPYMKASTSYYLSNQLHFIDSKQHLLQQHQQQQQQTNLSGSNNNIQQTCQLCREEDNLKRNIAHFLLHRKGLAKEKIGQYLGNLQEQFNQDVLKYYLQELDFYGLQIDLALRKFLSTFRLPGEAQKIERIVDCFAQRYVQCQQQQQPLTGTVFGANAPIATIPSMNNNNNNHQHEPPQTPQQQQQQHMQRNQNNQQPPNTLNYKNNLILLSKDEIFILTFAIIMLNTDLHSPSLKPTSRMSAQQFVNNLRGVFKSQTINESDLIEIYERVKANQITTTPDHVTHVMKVQQGLTVTNFQRKELPNLCVPHRRLVCFCRLFEVYDVNKKERIGQHQREIFLFNDLLLVTKLVRRVRANTTQLYTYRQSISLQGLYVQLFQSPHYNFGIRLCQRSNDETLIMFNARNELDQSRFVDDLGESIAEMDEMERIKRHNIIETIHFKYVRRLRRHTMMHNVTENNIQSIDQSSDDNETNKSMENCDINNKQQLLEQNGKRLSDNLTPMTTTTTSSSSSSSSATTPTLTTSGRTQSKFSSMLNLSSACDGKNDTSNNNVDGLNSNNNQAQAQAQAKSLRMNQSFVQAQRLLVDQSGACGRQPILTAAAAAASNIATSGTQRRSSTSSVHSLDSGLFLSRDVSPNQSS